MPTPSLELEKIFVEDKLQKRELYHLRVDKRGANIVVYSNGENGKENRCRFTYIKTGLFILSMANYSGRWEATPFEGSLDELVEMVIEQFPWTLTNYDQF